MSTPEIEKMSLGGDIETVEYSKTEVKTAEEIKAEKRYVNKLKI